MTFRYLRWFLAVLGIVVLVLALSFAGAAVLAEGSVHPILKRRSSDTAALAYSIAHAAGSTARKVTITTKDGVRLNACCSRKPWSWRESRICHLWRSRVW